MAKAARLRGCERARLTGTIFQQPGGEGLGRQELSGASSSPALEGFSVFRLTPHLLWAKEGISKGVRWEGHQISWKTEDHSLWNEGKWSSGKTWFPRTPSSSRIGWKTPSHSSEEQQRLRQSLTSCDSCGPGRATIGLTKNHSHWLPSRGVLAVTAGWRQRPGQRSAPSRSFPSLLSAKNWARGNPGNSLISTCNWESHLIKLLKAWAAGSRAAADAYACSGIYISWQRADRMSGKWVMRSVAYANACAAVTPRCNSHPWSHFCHSLICIGNVVTKSAYVTEMGPTSTRTGWVPKYICSEWSPDLTADKNKMNGSPAKIPSGQAVSEFSKPTSPSCDFPSLTEQGSVSDTPPSICRNRKAAVLAPRFVSTVLWFQSGTGSPDQDSR